jgi:hypothetical protein
MLQLIYHKFMIALYAKNNKEKNVLSLYLAGVRFFGFKNPAHMHHFDRENNILQNDDSSDLCCPLSEAAGLTKSDLELLTFAWSHMHTVYC